MVVRKNPPAVASDKAISVVTAEWESLAGLPYLQVRLYLVLRWYMSVATCRVGEARGISLQGLCEELYVEPAPGRVDSGSPTKKAGRSALQQLEKHGLVEPCGNGEVLVFFLPKAGGASVRQKTKGHKRGTETGHAMGNYETPYWQGNQAERGHVMGQASHPIKGHTSEERVNLPTVEAAAAACSSPVDKSLLLLLPLLPEKVAEWIRLSERERGCRSAVGARAVQIAAWLAMGMTGDELHEAYRLAKCRREDEQSRAPINLPFLDVFVREVIKGRVVCRGEAVPAPRPALWWNSPQGVIAKAEEVGVVRESNEPIEALRGRVEFRLMLQAEAASQRRKAKSQAVAHA